LCASVVINKRYCYSGSVAITSNQMTWQFGVTLLEQRRGLKK